MKLWMVVGIAVTGTKFLVLPDTPPPSTPKTALPLLASEISGALRRDRPDRVSPTLSGQVLTAGLVNVRSAVK